MAWEKNVFISIEGVVPAWSLAEIRALLATFLFRTTLEVEALVSTLSGGEKARLSLAKIAANPPKLLILDEVTNNLGFHAKAHVVNVVKNYPGAMLVVSHDSDFLDAISLSKRFVIQGREWKELR